MILIFFPREFRELKLSSILNKKSNFGFLSLMFLFLKERLPSTHLSFKITNFFLNDELM